MLNEWRAVNDCAGIYVQKALYLDRKNRSIIFEYDSTAKSLIHLNLGDSELFVTLLPGIIRAIDHCHKCGWSHGDIKPSNILFIPKTCTIRLIDFGASQRLGRKRSALSFWQFTPQFASNNQKEGTGRVDEMDDWCALLKLIEQFLQSKPNSHLFQKVSYVQSALRKYIANEIE
ncbi:serine/threonine-protein kinase [Vibrio aestuarianus]|uniref:serine/threonine-protein kinase n=1 Tax=Vibrio aestuarianus TaxID=28171 RepID=UPI0021C3A994|nr:serine/threonine-protein kinase [Vibrio aestuarianus]MDE1211241.1 serine/threonine-protein kinase [Vibrio aestuarianus]MDE1319543.1 serine/threonine-protein kinase [Vibrio aestuarianus]